MRTHHPPSARAEAVKRPEPAPAEPAVAQESVTFAAPSLAGRLALAPLDSVPPDAAAGEDRSSYFEPLASARPSGAGRPLAESERAYFEARFGRELPDVRLHSGGEASRLARAVEATAYAVGRDVVFAEGALRPETREGRHLLAHELTHVLQQAQAPAASAALAASGRRSEPGEPAEREAERAADAVVAGAPVGPIQAAPAGIARHKAAGKYKAGSLSKPAGWTYIAYLETRKAHLVSLPKKGTHVGTVDWATNNPGSVDYDWPSDKQPPGEAAKKGSEDSYEKDPSDQLFRRFAVYENEEEGRAAVLKVLKVFANQKENASIESTLVKFKGMEKDGMDVKIILRAELAKKFPDPKELEKEVDAEFARLGPEGRKEKVKTHYLGLIRDALRKQGLTEREIQDLLTKPFSNLAKGSAEADKVINAVLRAESAANPPGVLFECGKGLSVPASSVKRSKAQERVIADLMKEKASVEAELAAVLGCAASPSSTTPAAAPPPEAPKAEEPPSSPSPNPLSPPQAAPQPPPPLLQGPENQKIVQANAVAARFEAEKGWLVQTAGWLQGQSSRSGKDYSDTYTRFVARRDPWPGQLDASIAALKKDNAAGYADAIGRLEALRDWLRNDGQGALYEVHAPE